MRKPTLYLDFFFIGQLFIQDCTGQCSVTLPVKACVTEHPAATDPPVLVPLVFLDRERDMVREVEKGM